MAMQRGRGKLYDTRGEQAIAVVNYQIYENLQTEYTQYSWGGVFTIDHIIWPIDEPYILELEDGRRGTIIIPAVHLQSGQTIYNYPFQGSGLLE